MIHDRITATLLREGDERAVWRLIAGRIGYRNTNSSTLGQSSRVRAARFTVSPVSPLTCRLPTYPLHSQASTLDVKNNLRHQTPLSFRLPPHLPSSCGNIAPRSSTPSRKIEHGQIDETLLSREKVLFVWFGLQTLKPWRRRSRLESTLLPTWSQ